MVSRVSSIKRQKYMIKRAEGHRELSRCFGKFDGGKESCHEILASPNGKRLGMRLPLARWSLFSRS